MIFFFIERYKKEKEKIKMAGLVNGIYRVCSALSPVALAVLILMLVVAGISSMISGAEAEC